MRIFNVISTKIKVRPECLGTTEEGQPTETGKLRMAMRIRSGSLIG